MIPQPEQELLLSVIKALAKARPFFTGGVALAQWRQGGSVESTRDWRNKWGSMIVKAEANGWIVKAGRELYPETPQSHTNNLTLWQSALFVGPTKPTPRDNVVVGKLQSIANDVAYGEMLVQDALWAAYELGRLRRIT